MPLSEHTTVNRLLTVSTVSATQIIKSQCTRTITMAIQLCSVYDDSLMQRRMAFDSFTSIEVIISQLLLTPLVMMNVSRSSSPDDDHQLLESIIRDLRGRGQGRSHKY